MKVIVFLTICLPLVGFCQPTDLFLFLGQSNMAGRAPIEGDTLPIKNVFILDQQGMFVPANNPLNRYSTIRKDDYSMQRIGPAYQTAATISKYLDDSIRIIVQARGGTAIEKFMKGEDWGYYESIINRTIHALQQYPDSRLKAVFWHQGESNSGHPEGYIGNLSQLIADLRADLNQPNLPVFIGEIGQWREAYAFMREKMKQIPDSIPNTYLISSKGLTNQDDAHFDRPSVLEFGKRYGEKCIEVIYE